jgi:UDP-galactopyranose mutase
MDFIDADYVIVGVGFFGATLAERIANDSGKKVVIIEKRKHIGGNCYSEINKETGIEYHTYGTHVFHTSDKKVWDYINRFTTFNGYYHQVLTTFKNKVYQMPVNLETVNSFYNTNLKPFELESFLAKERMKEYYDMPKNFEEQAINHVGRPLYEAFFKGYTIKQWGKDPIDIPASVISRLPFRHNYNESYYFDTWQGIPTDGYEAIFKKMLSSNKISLYLDTDYFGMRSSIPKETSIIYTGSLDKLLNYKYGVLEYRSLNFEFKTYNYEDFQGTSVMNYAEVETPYTRIHEPRHLHPERQYTKEKTLTIYEFSKADNKDDPYYPLGSERNNAIYKKYREEIDQSKNIMVGGRLGDYKYYDMHHTIGKALELYETQIKFRENG